MDDGRSMRVAERIQATSQNVGEALSFSPTRTVGGHLACPQKMGCKLVEIADYLGTHAAHVNRRLKQV